MISLIIQSQHKIFEMYPYGFLQEMTYKV